MTILFGVFTNISFPTFYFVREPTILQCSAINCSWYEFGTWRTYKNDKRNSFCACCFNYLTQWKQVIQKKTYRAKTSMFIKIANLKLERGGLFNFLFNRVKNVEFHINNRVRKYWTLFSFLRDLRFFIFLIFFPKKTYLNLLKSKFKNSFYINIEHHVTTIMQQTALLQFSNCQLFTSKLFFYLLNSNL